MVESEFETGNGFIEEIMEVKKLFEPIQVGNMLLKNRAVYAPMIVGMAGPMGEMTPELIEYYVETARAGMGLLTIEGALACEGQKGQARQMGICNNEQLSGLSDLLRAIHTHVPNPPKVSIQLMAFGRETEPEITGTDVSAPSAIPSVLHPIFQKARRTKAHRGGIPRELSIEEIIEIEDQFVDAAERAKFAGFDAVEFHAGHGYLIAQFLSPFTNRRTDLYGQDRTLFLTNLINKTKMRLGNEYPIIVRVSGSEFMEGGATIEERQVLAKKLQDLGVCALSVSGGIYETGYYIIPPMMIPRGCHIDNAARIKEAVDIPVYAAGRINDPRLAEKALTEKRLDLVAFGRPFITDRAFLHKAREGRFREIRKCIACNNCLDALFDQRRVECTVNPAVGDTLDGERGFERASRAKAVRSKRVIVVGGGPAGMEAARIATERGHKVTLFEKKDHLGGNLITAAAVSFKREILSLLEFQKHQLEKNQVEVQLGREVTADEILGMMPEAVVLASGSTAIFPDIPGMNKYRDKVASPVDVLRGEATLGKRIAIVGGGMIGCEVAAWARENGHEATLVTRRSSAYGLGEGLAADWGSLCRLWLLTVKWPTLGVEVLELAQYNELTAEGVITVNRKWHEHLIPADSVVFCLGFKPNDALKEELNGKVPELHVIGDCSRPRRILDAIREGTVCAQSL